MKIEIYTISELQDLLLSERFKTSMDIPLSPERAASYLQNPRADKDMPVLFLISENEKLLAYRTLLPDYFYSNDEKISFAWLSGNYVHPEVRRKGFSTRLFHEVNDAWKGKLMYTNYAPASKAVYDKTSSFIQFAERAGKRYYLKSSLQNLLKERLNAPKILKFGDSLLNTIKDLRSTQNLYQQIENIHVSVLNKADPLINTLIENQQKTSLFRRNLNEFNWIKNYPWVTEYPTVLPDSSYHFTRKVANYSSKWFKLESEAGIAFLWITQVNEKCSIPYFFHNDHMLVIAARQLIINEMLENEAAYITIRHPELGPVLGTRKNPFLFSRNMPQRYYVHKELSSFLPEAGIIMDGDGDCVFT